MITAWDESHKFQNCTCTSIVQEICEIGRQQFFLRFFFFGNILLDSDLIFVKKTDWDVREKSLKSPKMKATADASKYYWCWVNEAQGRKKGEAAHLPRPRLTEVCHWVILIAACDDDFKFYFSTWKKFALTSEVSLLEHQKVFRTVFYLVSHLEKVG